MRVTAILAAATLFAATAGAHAASCSATVCYTYDAFGRLVTVTYHNGTTLTYAYDNTDNTLAKTVTCSQTGC